MKKKERIIVRYLNQRWYKKALIITADSNQKYLEKINALNLVNCTGYLNVKNPVGCVFDISEWPFECGFFDLIIIDNSFIDSRDAFESLFYQLYFCLSDDGEVIISSSGQVRLYKLLLKTFTSGFFTKRIKLINHTNSFFVNLIKRVISKNFVIVLKKENIRKNGLKVSDMVKGRVKRKVYTSCTKEIYDLQKEK